LIICYNQVGKDIFVSDILSASSFIYIWMEYYIDYYKYHIFMILYNA